MLQYNKDAVVKYLEQGVDEDEGCEGAFEPVYEVSERVRIRFSPFFPSESV